jgi:hypothetical protein
MTSTRAQDACAHVGSGCPRPLVNSSSNALARSLEIERDTGAQAESALIH